MAKNPFTSVSDVTRKIGKNYYDWSHDYNFTGKIGTIYPVFAKYCPAGQSLSIDMQAGLQFMPMQFPVQSKMKLKLSAWRMPLRAMWKDYTNLVSSQNQPDVQKNYVAPYIDFNHSGAYTDMLAVGGLCDYLRIPSIVNLPSFGYSYAWPSYSDAIVYKAPYADSWKVGSTFNLSAADSVSGNCGSLTNTNMVTFPFSGVENLPLPPVSSASYAFKFTLDYGDAASARNALFCMQADRASFSNSVVMGFPSTLNGSFVATAVLRPYKFEIEGSRYVCAYFKLYQGDFSIPESAKFFTIALGLGASNFNWVIPANPSSEKTTSRFGMVRLGVVSDFVESLNASNSPYFDSSISPSPDNRLKLSAYPFRMYEAIYNSYIRYIRNNPFKKDGKAVYNEWLPTMEGGADKTSYKLHRCNWAADAYTTAVQSPQQGVAPVVGLSQATVTAEDGVSRVVPAITTEDGRTYGIEFKANEFGLEGVDYTELGTGAKVAPVHSMYALAQSGISIEDFRMTNAYQRYLELNMMRGYSYKQIVEGRFEVNVKYDDLLMPEFCGGMTRDVFVSGVQQNVEDNGGSGSYVGSLGSQAGDASCRGDLGHKIKIYCDEPSYVMILAYVVPQTIYSQVCPKDFLYRDLLDAWSPEFDQIGFQPIKLSELCPVEAYQVSSASLNDTFGFQRPWHEYCEVPDASVGLFNTELRNFLMHRVFDSIPKLGEKFTTVNSESVDHVFSVTEFTDKFFGQIHFSIDVKSPVSRVVIPSLE